MKNKRKRLTPRDRELLALVARYRIATDELWRLAFFPNVSNVRAVRKVAQRLVKHKYLREYEICKDDFYYILAPRGARAIGVKPSEPRPFTEQSLPSALAIAWYCVRHGVSRFTAQEFVTRFPDLSRSQLRSSAYFIEQTPTGLQLGLFVTDRGTTPRRMLSKIRKVIHKRYKMPAFASLIQVGRFNLVILTGFPAKKDQLERAIERQHRGPVGVRVEVIAELGAYLTGLAGHAPSGRQAPGHA